jgi:phospholipase/carboxylesterase
MGDTDLRRGARQPARRLVLLHGWGADADDLIDLGEALVPDAARRGVELLALQAPEPHPSGAGRSWYDLQEPEWPGVVRAREDLSSRLEELAVTLPLPATILLGFSQGGAMAVDVGCSLPLAGVVACSAYPHPGWQPPRPPQPPVLLTHGREDPVVPFQAGQALARCLSQAGARVAWLPGPGGHAIDGGLLDPIRAFLEERWRSDPVA